MPYVTNKRTILNATITGPETERGRKKAPRHSIAREMTFPNNESAGERELEGGVSALLDSWETRGGFTTTPGSEKGKRA